MNNRLSELIAPAGSLDCGIYAFKAGADAVYFGLSSFSARKFATNFDENQYRKLLEYANKNNKKVYLTLNTIIKEDEIIRLIEILKFIQIFPPDALIIQDFGIIDLLRYFLPYINIHASTQAGTFSLYSYDFIKKLRIKRVILARELPFNEIVKLKEKFNDIEVEVFIHGALCYSFSGYCLASGLMLGRSANRGECAQICRNFFNITSKSEFDNMSLSLFSCNDLNLGLNIIKLVNAKIDSFKIEGRMKSPEYVYNTVKFYRKILDMGLREIPTNYKIEGEKEIKLCFSRFQTDGYFNYKNADNLINPFIPGHIGINLGTIINFSKSYIELFLKEDISRKDGILIIFKFNEKISLYPISIDKITKNNKEVNRAYKKDKVKIFSNKLNELILKTKGINYLEDEFDNLDINYILKNNFLTVKKISDRNLDLKKINENLLIEKKYEITLKINIIDDEKDFFNINQDKEDYQYLLTLNYEFIIHNEKYENSVNFEAFNRKGSISYLQIFEESLSSIQKEDLFIIKTEYDEKTKDILDKVFVKPSVNKEIIKNIKNHIRFCLSEYLKVDNIEKFKIEESLLVNNFLKIYEHNENDDNKIRKKDIINKLKESRLLIENKFERKDISPITFIDDKVDCQQIPFITLEHLKITNIYQNNICKIDNLVFLPLHPIVINQDEYIEKLEYLLNQDNNIIYLLGINASWHFYLYEKYLNKKNVFFFLDFYIYIANRFSLFYYSKFNKIVFGFFWIEYQKEISNLHIKFQENKDYPASKNINNIKSDTIFSPLPLYELEYFNPPLFISRGCLQRNLFNINKCEINCKKKFLYTLKNQKNNFYYIIDNCISYLFEEY